MRMLRENFAERKNGMMIEWDPLSPRKGSKYLLKASILYQGFLWNNILSIREGGYYPDFAIPTCLLVGFSIHFLRPWLIEFWV
jgi:hypothetical protein